MAGRLSGRVLERHGVMALQGRHGLVFAPHNRVALMMEEYHGRLTIVLDDGEVAHRPGPLPSATQSRTDAVTLGTAVASKEARTTADGEPEGAPWHLLQDGVLAHPVHGRVRGRKLVFPGGWTFALPVAWPARARPRAAADPVVAGLGVRASQVLYLGQGQKGLTWFTEQGEVPWPGLVRDAVGLHPHLVKAGNCHVNVRRLASATRDGEHVRLAFDQGTALVMSLTAARSMAKALGLASLERLEPCSEIHAALYREHLRDWPCPLFDMSAEDLRHHFEGDERGLIANVLWQIFRLRQQGENPDYGVDSRGVWYRPMFPILVRAGFVIAMTDESEGFTADEGWDITFRPTSDPHYNLYVDVLQDLVGHAHLLSYQDLGFREPRPDLRTVGSVRPDVLLVAEKGSLEAETREVGSRFGVSTCVLAGQPSFLVTEFLVKALLAEGVTQVVLVAYVDFDPAGWIIADALAAQMARYGMGTASVRHLVLPSRFTRHELEYCCEPLAGRSEAAATMLRAWLERTGGIGGRPLGIHADHLRPVDRVVKAFAEETGLKEVGR